MLPRSCCILALRSLSLLLSSSMLVCCWLEPPDIQSRRAPSRCGHRTQASALDWIILTTVGCCWSRSHRIDGPNRCRLPDPSFLWQRRRSPLGRSDDAVMIVQCDVQELIPHLAAPRFQVARSLARRALSCRERQQRTCSATHHRGIANSGALQRRLFVRCQA